MQDRNGPWRLGIWRRGSRTYAAITGTGSSRRRISLDATDKQGAQAAVNRLNLETAKALAIASDKSVLALFDTYIAARQQSGTSNIKRIKEVRKVIERVWPRLAPEDLDRQEVRRFTAIRHQDGCGDATIRQELAYLTAALNFAKDEKLIVDVPSIEKPPPPRPRERYLSRGELTRLLDACPMLYAKLFIVMAISTAARPKHILELTWDRVDFRHRLIDFDDPKRHKTRKGRARVPMNETAYEHLKAARELATTEYVIEADGRNIESIRRAIKRSADRAGMPEVSQYVLRHTAGVWMAQAGVSLAKIAEYMGHASIETTRKHYARFSPDYLRDASDALELIRRPTGSPEPPRQNLENTKHE